MDGGSSGGGFKEESREQKVGTKSGKNDYRRANNNGR